MINYSTDKYIASLISGDKSHTKLLNLLEQSDSLALFVEQLNKSFSSKNASSNVFKQVADRVAQWVTRNNKNICEGDEDKVIKQLTGFSVSRDTKNKKLVVNPAKSAQQLKHQNLKEKEEKKEEKLAKEAHQARTLKQETITEYLNENNTLCYDTINHEQLVNLLKMYKNVNGEKNLADVIGAVMREEVQQPKAA